jgi:uncharacterized protein YutE (UPF0331/DUF86 family)
VGPGHSLGVDEARRQRYRDKLAHADERLGDLQAWLDEAPESKLHLLAVMKAMQELVEAITDVAAMAVKDGGDLPAADYANIDRLERAGRLSSPTAAAMRDANGLRNRIVHEYNGFWDDVGLASIERLLPALAVAIEEARAWA